MEKEKEKDFVLNSMSYVELYTNNKKLLLENSRKFMSKCNELTFNEERLKVLKKIKKALDKEDPRKDDCPTCRQRLPDSIENVYEYLQDLNHTVDTIDLLEKKIRKLEKEVEKLKNEQKDLDSKNVEYYSTLEKYGFF